MIVFAIFTSAFAAPNYGSPDIRITSSYAAPAVVRTAAYAEPALKVDSYSSYAAAPAVRTFEHIPIVRQLLDDDNYGTYNLE